MSALNLINLPTEVLIGIFENLSSKDMLNCSLVCKKLNEVVRTPTFYRQHSIFIPNYSTEKLASFIQWFEPISSAKKISYLSYRQSNYVSEMESKFVQIIGDCKFLEILEIDDRREPSNKIVYKLPRTLRRLETQFEEDAVGFTGTQGLKELKIEVFEDNLDVRCYLCPITLMPPFIERCTNLVSLEICKCKFTPTEIMTFANLENLESLSLSTKGTQDISGVLIEALEKCRFPRLTKIAMKNFTFQVSDVFDEMAVQMPRICSFICRIHDFRNNTMRSIDLDKFAQYLESQPNITEVKLYQRWALNYADIEKFLNRLTEISKMNPKLCFEIGLEYDYNCRVYAIKAVKDESNDISVSTKLTDIQPLDYGLCNLS